MMTGLPGLIAGAAGVVALAALAWAAWTDVATRTIPDLASAGLLFAGLVHRLTWGMEAAAVSLLAGFAVLAVLVLAHARGLVGGGDVKLVAAASVYVAPSGIFRLLTAVTVAGGVLALAHLALRRMNLRDRSGGARGRGTLGRIVAAEAWRIRRHGPLPYGLAIAAGGVWSILRDWP